jgi:hypothetical protein
MGSHAGPVPRQTPNYVDDYRVQRRLDKRSRKNFFCYMEERET